MPELREMIDKSRELYPQAFPGAKFREVEKLWNFQAVQRLSLVSWNEMQTYTDIKDKHTVG